MDDKRSECRWVPTGEGGILSQAVVAVVFRAVPHLLARRWVLLRWQGTPIADIAAHFLSDEQEVRVVLREARARLLRSSAALLHALLAEEGELLEEMRNSRYDRPPPVSQYAELRPGVYDEHPVVLRPKLVSADERAEERLQWMLGLLLCEAENERS